MAVYTMEEVCELTNISKKDLGQLIAHARIRRPNRVEGNWQFDEAGLEELQTIPQDLLPSYQRRARRNAFWTNALQGVEISASAITLAQSACEDTSLEESHTQQIVDNYAKEFVAWYKQTDPSDLSHDERKIFDRINDACVGFVELSEALNLVRECKLITTRQLSLACDTTATVIRKLWNDRRVCPHTQNYAGHLMWKVTQGDIDDIKAHIAGTKQLPAQRIQARRDIIHFTVADESDE